MAGRRGNTFECVICKEKIETKRKLLCHYYGSHKTILGTHACNKCAFISRSRFSVVLHKSVRHGSRRHGSRTLHRCSECWYTTQCGARTMWSHVLASHGRDSAGLPCPRCTYQAGTRLALAKHLVQNLHTPRKRGPRHVQELQNTLRCLRCDYQCRWRANLVRHVNTRHGRPSHSHTGSSRHHSSGAGGHPLDKIRLDHKLNKFFCTECKYSSKRKTSILAHVNLQHKVTVEKFKCTHCSYTTKVKGRLSKHMEKHSKTGRKGKRNSNKYSQFVKDSSGIYKCTECDYTTKWRSSIIAHMDNYHNPDAEEYKCQQCSYKTRVKAYLQQHRVTHRIASSQGGSGSVAGKKLKRTPRKYKQIVRDSELNMYRCSECDYSTKWRSSIIAHVDNYHNPDAEIYSCPKCSYKCKVKSYLQQHLLTHERGNSTAGRRVTGSSKYKQLSYDGARDLFTCTDCEYTSKWRGSVIAHIGLRHNSDATLYRCPHCPYSSKVKSYFVQHSRTHDAKLFKCEVCSFVTKNKRTLEHHATKEHSHLIDYTQGGTGTGAQPAGHYQPGQGYLGPDGAYYPFKIEYDDLMCEWPAVENEVNEVPDINSLEPSIESSPDLTLAIEMNLNDDNNIQNNQQQQPGYAEVTSPADGSVELQRVEELQCAVQSQCPYCMFTSYSRDEIVQHMITFHQAGGSPGGGGVVTAGVATTTVTAAIPTTAYYYHHEQQSIPLQLNL